FHERSIYGGFRSGGLAPVWDVATNLPVMQLPVALFSSVQSPLIDRGRPGDGFANEPTPNGGLVNAGAYGNTAQAGRSAPANNAPVAAAVQTATANNRSPVSLTLAYSDPDSDTLTVTFDTQPAKGTLGTLNPATRQVSYTPSKFFQGVDSFTFTVSDGHGGTATAAMQITLTDVVAPVVTIDTQYTASTRPTITGTIDDPTASISVTVGSFTYSVVNAGTGTWSLAGSRLVSPLTVGTYNVAVSSTDAQGNVGTDGTTSELVITSGDPEGETLVAALPVSNGGGSFVRSASIGDGLAGAKDVDLYRIALPQGWKLSAAVFARRLDPASALDSYLRIFDASGVELRSNDDIVGSRDSEVLDYVVPSTALLYIGVSGYETRGYNPSTTSVSRTDSQTTGAYELRLTFAAPDTTAADRGGRRTGDHVQRAGQRRGPRRLFALPRRAASDARRGLALRQRGRVCARRPRGERVR
ncbi:MAG: Ig-like domain-containing protein, partial [Planctomycetia bacterium]